MTRVLVTGATGFVGRILCVALAKAGYSVRAALRTDRAVPGSIAEKVVVGDINSTSDWDMALEGVDTVIHAAARVHVLRDATTRANLYADTNEHGTRWLAESAARANVRRFVFLSSIKVNGEGNGAVPYGPFDTPHPTDGYAISKWNAEQHLMRVTGNSSMEVVIVRPPLVYGPGVRANFLRLLRWVDVGWPLPLADVRNKRSLVSVWNLCDLLVRLVWHPGAAGRTWMVSDASDLSTSDLLLRIGDAMDRRVRLFAVPRVVLMLLASISGRRAEVLRLTDSLVVDITQTCRDLEWSPPLTVQEALARTAAWYLGEDKVHEA